MKTNLLHILRVSLPVFLLSFLFFSVSAQVDNPSSWETFIMDKELNKASRDTFLLQGFENSRWDNWLFEVFPEENVEVADASALGITGQNGGASLMIRGETTLTWKVNKYENYEKLYITLFAAGKELKKDAQLIVKSRNRDKTSFNQTFIVPSNDYQLNFKDQMFKDGLYFYNNQFYMSFDPYEMTITTVNNPEGYFLIDELMAFGDIQRYSLFSGSGSWDEEERWSMLPAYRRRRALIRGDVAVTRDVKCQEIHLAEGAICVGEEANLQAVRTFLHVPGSAVYTKGWFETTRQVTCYRTFPEKGKWYFISFPFDVYRGDIDPAFTLADEQPNQGGDVYYILTYDGVQRSDQNQATGNWKVVSKDHPSDVPLFEKGKGYLIALDEKASFSRLSVISPASTLQRWDNRLFSMELDIPLKPSHTVTGNHGWVLCGNPFPAPLPVKQIQVKGTNNYSFYYFDGHDYILLDPGSDVQLPAFSAFFVKADSRVSLSMLPPDVPSSGPLLSVDGSQRVAKEPGDFSYTYQVEKGTGLTGRVQGKQLYIESPASVGEVAIYTVNGGCVLKKMIPKGSSSVDLTFAKGIYLFIVRAGEEVTQEKFVLY